MLRRQYKTQNYQDQQWFVFGGGLSTLKAFDF